MCSANDAVIRLVQDNRLRLAAHHGSIEPGQGARPPISRGTAIGRAVIDRQTIHIHDLLTVPEIEFPESKRNQPISGARTTLATPLLRESVPIGVIFIRRTEVQPFSEKQIALLKTFADQAVIAIENVRLFQELQARNRDLSEALNQQTATSDVLRVIASSPTELQPVLDTVIANAVRLAGAKKGHIRQLDGELLRLVAHYGENPEMIAAIHTTPLRPGPDSAAGRAFWSANPFMFLMRERKPGHTTYPPGPAATTILAVPLMREGMPVGSVIIWRDFVEPFTERQIELVKTFADQAVIAIENVRLFQELKESLEQQTATSEILGRYRQLADGYSAGA